MVRWWSGGSRGRLADDAWWCYGLNLKVLGLSGHLVTRDGDSGCWFRDVFEGRCAGKDWRCGMQIDFRGVLSLWLTGGEFMLVEESA